MGSVLYEASKMENLYMQNMFSQMFVDYYDVKKKGEALLVKCVTFINYFHRPEINVSYIEIL